MIAEIGHFALILALIVAVIQGVLPLVGAARGISSWMAAGRMCASANALFLTVAFASLAYCFYISDFTVLNVANNSNSLLPWYYKVAATWGSHEGSILFWSVTLSWWALAVSFASRRLSEEMMARVLGIMGLVLMGFLAFMLFTSNPFQRLFPAAPEGADLNPLLQDPGMVFHPPLLYLGYVGFSVPFAFALAALISGKLDVAWARWMRPWTTAAWILLTLGISLGSYWAYYELGWGGWWFWDPVENSSFMPWLTGTALMHSLAVTEKRGCFKIWTVLLAIITFSLSLLGTFLVRSGVLTSVHAFATDPERGVFILAFLIIVIGLSFLLFAWRAPTVGLGGNFSMVSRESMLLVNNVLLVVAMGAVLLGTLYPLFLDALNAGKIISRESLRVDTLEVHEKTQFDFFSRVDTDCQEEICRTISHYFPNDGIIAEEGDFKQHSDAESVWYIDPLDVVYDPTRNELFYAEKSQGAFMNDSRIRVSGRSEFSKSLIGTGFPFRRNDDYTGFMSKFEKVARDAAGLRRAGSAALDLCWVASGRLDAYWEANLKSWDICAGALIVLEAGGLVTDLKGGENFLADGCICCGTPKIFAPLIAKVGDFGTPKA